MVVGLSLNTLGLININIIPELIKAKNKTANAPPIIGLKAPTRKGVSGSEYFFF
ncbi:hypothetical protein COO91_02108 [Nostoc flagelliforme CCNUN1]|uniref:Uncharacterized protein n=1 Tax=Nostoc flagelliforme CCNUN1 TaxID=2038116 RepID=A0A2K8SMZ0_9NOSO|nr:hypothetical protein COO91_02108 [Nostoc flagelliforme CCNUN1]